MIYIITHKQANIKLLDGYMPLLVGAAFRNKDYGYLKDSSGDNISEKNKNYCELTGVYWVWKNTSDDYVGIQHYRRFFNCSLRYRHIIDETLTKKILKKYDIIVPFKQTTKKNMYDQYCNKSGKAKDLELLKEVINELYPEYTAYFEELLQTNQMYFYNMLITNRQLYDDYCEWLFNILFSVEKRIDLTDYDEYQQRIFGFMAERLFNLYLYKNEYRLFHAGVTMDEEWPLVKRIITGLKRKAYYIYQMYINK